MPRGGKRNGTQGKAYSNRTDLGGQNVVQPQTTSPNRLAVQVPPSQSYGDGVASRQSQKIVPVAGNPSPTLPSAPQPNLGGGGGTPITPMFAPTAFPQQPVTAGVANSPGAGPEALNLEQGIPLQYQTAKSVIQQMASDPNSSPAIQYLASRINGAF